MTASQQLGSQLKAARSKAQLSLRKLATLARIPATTIAGYEKGNKIPADNFLRIADALQHHAYEIDGNFFSVERTDLMRKVPARDEQLTLDFSGEYDYSRASIRIHPGKITVSFDGVRSSLRPKTLAVGI
jgi:transcriptional regulator with XRE-family HTH domain